MTAVASETTGVELFQMERRTGVPLVNGALMEVTGANSSSDDNMPLGVQCHVWTAVSYH